MPRPVGSVTVPGKPVGESLYYEMYMLAFADNQVLAGELERVRRHAHQRIHELEGKVRALEVQRFRDRSPMKRRR